MVHGHRVAFSPKTSPVDGWLIYRLTSGSGVENAILLINVGLDVLVLLKCKRGERTINGSSNGTETEEPAEKPAREIILDTIRSKGDVKRKDLLRVTEMTKSSLGRLLDAMETKGLIAQSGKRKAAFYTKGKNL